jgi:type I restriction enzyme S subunit
MRDGWTETSLGEVADVLSGFAFKSELFSEKQGIPLIRIRDLQKQTWTEVGYVGDFDERYVVNKGDFLIGMDGEFRCYEWLGGKALLNQRVCRIQDFASTQITPRFVYFLVNNYLEEIEKSTSYTTVKHISIKQVKGISFPLPPLTEQKRIVDVVTSVDSYIDALQQQANTARTARNAVLHELLTAGGDDWTETSLGKTLEIARGGSPRPIQDFITSAEDGVNWVKIGDASASSKYIYRTEQKIRPEGVPRSRQVKVGDFILSNSMSFGRPYIMRTDGCIHDGWLLLSNVEKHFDEDFLYNLLMSDLVQKQFDSLAAGSGVRNLNIEVAKEVVIPLPPLKVQRDIAEVANGLDEFILAVEQALLAAKNLRSGLLSDLLSGEHEIPESYDVFVGAA